ncbi:uncharacterized protein PHACADRAFT_96414 [Phanerochaete carnosa HHB-10118-sp]|uniref:EthD domain-containing protein n=1 Tax=Phanerochaete carnosa (strain HHB-10118-sp) TaxID=650164 RepID=K5WUG7_PHACS|nr:uncharacterized protein PHACADRAFT_96414 [Phanerochaete carnosa HHB-10118-sp]EKM54102.1 hypothetical protein PHACADRAFT_96414 [Phanerochaete carnosa HHB-10118-sp]
MSATISEPTSTLRQDRVRAVALMYPKEGVSFEEFDKYWLEEHSKVFTSIAIVKKNLTKYEQFHFNPTVNQALQTQGSPALPHAGMAIFEAESYEKLMKVFKDSEYVRVVMPDEEKFFDRSKSTVLTGPFATIFGQ